MPAIAGQSLRYQRYDWTQDALAEWVEVPPGVPIVVEGVFCLAEGVREAYSYTIWCSASPELRLACGLARDGEAARAVWVESWMPADDRYAATQKPEYLADLVVDSSVAEVAVPGFVW